MANAQKLMALSMVGPLAVEVARQIDDSGGGSPVSSDNVTVAAITADNFTFAGGTLTQFCQAIADAIPDPA